MKQLSGSLIVRAHGFMQKYKCLTKDTEVLFYDTYMEIRSNNGDLIAKEPLKKPERGGKPKGSGKYGRRHSDISDTFME